MSLDRRGRDRKREVDRSHTGVEVDTSPPGRRVVRVLEQLAELRGLPRLLAGPSWLSVHTLRLDPRWDPIRDHPRFKALLTQLWRGAMSRAFRRCRHQDVNTTMRYRT